VSPRLKSFLTSNLMVLVYALLIALCVVYRPSEVVRFIYAGF
jgi:hypothetical protein